MRKILVSFLMVIGLLGCSGCKFLEKATEDIYGWNLSACVSDFDTCWELFLDNADKFEDGFVDAMNAIGTD